jgi:hypothetical protein
VYRPSSLRSIVLEVASHSAPVGKRAPELSRGSSVKLIVLPTAEAIEVLQKGPRKTNAVLHVTC